MKILLTLGALALVLALNASSEVQAQGATSTLRVDISGLRNDHGSVRCALFAASKGFPNNVRHAMAKAIATGRGPRRVCTFSDLPPGRYAVSVLHDEDGNGTLNTTLFGAPVEGWGVSNNAPAGAFSPPSFAAARFEFTGAPVQIRVRY